MIVTKYWKQLGLNDVRLIGRDQFMLWLAAYPLFNFFILRYVVPWLAIWSETNYQTDIRPYYVLLSSYLLVVLVPMLIGVVAGLLLIEEREDNTLTAMLVTPVSLNQFVGYRLSLAAGFTFVLLLGFIPLVKIVALPLGSALVLAFFAAVSAPVTALLFFSIAQDKVQAFGVLKVLGTLNLVPAVAYAVGEPWQWLFGLHPAYWVAKAFWEAAAGSGYFFLYGFIGFLYNCVLLWFLTQRFHTLAYGKNSAE
jgi:fluoroquinolone transport system permease protein